MWSPLNIAEPAQDVGVRVQRRIYDHNEYMELMLSDGHLLSHNYSDRCMEEDTKMIAFFDTIVQTELQR